MKHSYDQWVAVVDDESAKLSQELYIIIDGATQENIAGQLQELDPNAKAFPLYMDTYHDSVLNAGAWIVPFKKNSAIAQWFFNKAETFPLGIIVATPTGQYTTFFDHAQGLLECRYPPQNKEDIAAGKTIVRGVFRYYDPRILYGISTFESDGIRQLVYGPALWFTAWEPGRLQVIWMERHTDIVKITDKPLLLAQAVIDHIWREVQLHTIIGTMGSDIGETLRAMPLAQSYALAKPIQERLSETPYKDNFDVGYALSSCLVDGKSFHSVLNTIVENRIYGYSSLDKAVEQVVGKQL